MPQKKTPPVRIPVRVDLEPDEHQQLRVVAAQAGKSMAEFARDLLRKAIKEKGK